MTAWGAKLPKKGEKSLDFPKEVRQEILVCGNAVESAAENESEGLKDAFPSLRTHNAR
jgi:hypothetical protein